MMLVSIILRTFNEEKHINTLLLEIFKQKCRFPFEVILVDSGSTDATLEIVSRYDVKILHISPEEFSFGRSLNLGIKNAAGKYCVFTSAHCYPTGPHWLEDLVTPFEASDVGLVYGRQTGNHLTKYSEMQIFKKWFPAHDINDSDLAFCNNANAAIRKSLWDIHPFDEMLTGLEDLDWAKFVKEKKYKIIYRTDAAVFHIHEETCKQIFNRYHREALAFKQIYPKENFSLIDFLRFFTMNVGGDYIHAVYDRVFLKNFFWIPTFRFLQFYATYKGNQFRTPISKSMQQRLYYPTRPKFLIRQQPIVADTPTDSTPVVQNCEVIDISRPLTPQIPVWPGSNTFKHEVLHRHESDCFHESEISMNLHTGTHYDFPLHAIKGGKPQGHFLLSRYIGKTIVLEYRDPGHIPASFLKNSVNLNHYKNVLIKTSNSKRQSTDSFNKDFIALEKEAATWLADQNINLIGVDGPSVKIFHEKENTTHEVLLNNDTLVLEGLDLSRVSPGVYTLIALPLSIPDGEGAPTRAVLIKGTIK